MKPLDPRLIRRVGAVRAALALQVVVAASTAALLIAQATVLAESLAGVFLGSWSAAHVGHAAVLLIAIGLLRGFVTWAGTGAARRAGVQVAGELRHQVLARVLVGDRQERPGEVAALVGTGTDAIEPYVASYLPQLVATAIIPLALALRIGWADLTSGVIILVTLPLVPLFMALVGRFTADRIQSQWGTMQRLSRHLHDLVAGLVTLRLFGRADDQAEALDRLGERHRRATMSALRAAFSSTFVLELVASLSVALVAVSLGLRLLSAHVGLATALVVLQLAPECYAPLRRVGAAFHAAQQGLDAAQDIIDTIERPLPAAGTSAVPQGPLEIVVEGVIVDRRDSRGGSTEPIGLTVRSGELVALRGPSGCGKSSLLDVVRGALPEYRGSVRINGIDTRALDRQSLAATVAWVPQRPVRLPVTVRAALAMGAPAATPDDIAAAAGPLGLAERLDQTLPSLSAGELQRVAMARAIVRVRVGGARLVLLDEPSANLDENTEELVAQAARGMTQWAAVLVVAHRPGLAAAADRTVHIGQPDGPVPSPAAVQRATAAATPGPRRIPQTSGRAALQSAASLDAPTEVPRRGSIRRLLADSRAERGGIALAAAASAGTALCGIGLLAVSAWLLSRAAEHPPIAAISLAAVGVRALAVGRAGSRYGERLAAHDAALRVIGRLRHALLHRLGRLVPAGLPGSRRGATMSYLLTDLTTIETLSVRVLLPPVGALAGAALAVVVGLLVSPPAGFALVGGVLVTGVVLPIASARADRGATRQAAQARAHLIDHAITTAEAAQEFAAYGQASEQLLAAAVQETRVAQATKRETRVAGLAQGAGVAVMAVTAALVLVTAAAGVRAGTVNGVWLATLVFVGLGVSELTAELPGSAQQVSALRSSITRLESVLQAPDPVAEPLAPATAPTGPLTLELQSITTGWPGQPPVLRDATLTLRPGTATVLLGPSGVGKSTLAAALTRLVPLTGGHPLNGIDVSTLAGDDVRHVVGWASQDAHFFDTTLRENLLLARPTATDDELHDALAVAGLDDWVSNLPGGLDTQVGVAAAAISGGEAQRLSVARLVLARPAVAVYDEPTAALDPPEAAALMARLLNPSAEQAVLVITHRREGIERADRVVTFDSGRLVPTAPADQCGHQGDQRHARQHQRTRPLAEQHQHTGHSKTTEAH